MICKCCGKDFTPKAVQHRLLCGDSTKGVDVGRLMGADKADTMWTDSPYGVSYVGKTKRALTIKNDGADGLRALLDGFLATAQAILAPSSALELDPAYCDTIVTRWQRLTGQEATLDGNGSTFEHVKFGRRLGVQDAIKEELHGAPAL